VLVPQGGLFRCRLGLIWWLWTG